MIFLECFYEAYINSVRKKFGLEVANNVRKLFNDKNTNLNTLENKIGSEKLQQIKSFSKVKIMQIIKSIENNPHYMGKGFYCELCGYNKYPPSLGVHYLSKRLKEKEQKEFKIAFEKSSLKTIATLARKWNDKWITLCLNCHQIIEKEKRLFPKWRNKQNFLKWKEKNKEDFWCTPKLKFLNYSNPMQNL